MLTKYLCIFYSSDDSPSTFSGLVLVRELLYDFTSEATLSKRGDFKRSYFNSGQLVLDTIPIINGTLGWSRGVEFIFCIRPALF